MTEIEAARVAYMGALFRAAASPTDWYHADREDAVNAAERLTVKRTYLRALIHELNRRALGHTLRWKKAASDDELWPTYTGYWRNRTDDELMALYDAIASTRER